MQQNLFSGNTVHILGDEQILSVSELSGIIKSTVEKNFVDLKVQGEVSGLKIHSSGHIYFTLKDNDSVINAICWRGTKLSFPLEEGVQIIARGRVTVYPARSQYQFIVEEATIAGEGALLKLLNERRKKFQELGYFDRKRQLPKYPQKIGIVTSKTGAVLQDMLHRLKDRYQFCTLVVWSVNVQGNGASEQIANAIRGFNFMTDKRPDILIVARGGGSIEDLWPFNEEIVIKAVYDSMIPVISAIGHETDTTLIDYASDLRAPTPTAAIELCTPVLSEVRLHLVDQKSRVNNSMIRILNEHRSRINIISKAMLSCKFAIIGLTQKFDELSENLAKAIMIFFNFQKLRIEKQKIGNLHNYITLKKQRLDCNTTYFDRLIKTYFEKYTDILKILCARLEQSSYRKILEKGFCFITDNKGTPIKTRLDFSQRSKSEIEIHFYDGVTKI